MRLPLQAAACLALLCQSRAAAAAVDTAVTICIAADIPFNMRKGTGGAAATPLQITDTNESDIVGFDAEFRQRVLKNHLPHWNVNLRVLANYPQIVYETRMARCDVGFAPYLQTAGREACGPSCLHPTTSADGEVTYPQCCIDYR